MEMSRRSITTTTSFIISSNESLNKPLFSSSQSTTSSDMIVSDTLPNGNQLYASLEAVNGQIELPMNGDQRPQALTMHSMQYGAPIQTTNSLSMTMVGPQHPHPSDPLSDSRSSSGSNVIQQLQLGSNDLNQQNRNTSISLNGCTSTTSQATNGCHSVGLSFTTNHSPTVSNSTSPIVQLNSNHGLRASPSNLSCNSGKTESIGNSEADLENSLMPLNVKSMLLHGVSSDEIMKTWLTSIKCGEYLRNFVDNGYDMPLLTRMTPQDLTAIGCTSPVIRKKLLAEIKKLNIDDDIPQNKPHTLDQWLDNLKLGCYRRRLFEEGYHTIERVCQLTWEDLEDIGIYKLGHQKRLLLGIERIKKLSQEQDDRMSDQAIYDVHPNHRISLNPDNRLSTINRSTVRSGFFSTRSSANLDSRGLPVATVMPALKHINSSLANLDSSYQALPINERNQVTKNQDGSERNGTYGINENPTNSRKNPPPLPPVRTNSLKFPVNNADLANNIYGNFQGSLNVSNPPNGPTTFLRTPKLGTLTATTNKMLIQGGHIQTCNIPGRPSMPVREAPLPPAPKQPTIVERLENNIPMQGVQGSTAQSSPSSLINNALISHQLASADEFPPPPPCQ